MVSFLGLDDLENVANSCTILRPAVNSQIVIDMRVVVNSHLGSTPVVNRRRLRQQLSTSTRQTHDIQQQAYFHPHINSEACKQLVKHTAVVSGDTHYVHKANLIYSIVAALRELDANGKA